MRPPPPPRRHYTYRPNPGNNGTIPTVPLPIQGGRGAAAPPIDWMHLKTRENFVLKCMIIG